MGQPRPLGRASHELALGGKLGGSCGTVLPGRLETCAPHTGTPSHLPVAHGRAKPPIYPLAHMLASLVAFLWLHPALSQGVGGEAGGQYAAGLWRLQRRWLPLPSSPSRTIYGCSSHQRAEQHYPLFSKPEQPLLRGKQEALLRCPGHSTAKSPQATDE